MAATAAFADDAVWAAEDWSWDPHNMQATPADTPAAGKSSGGKGTRTAAPASIDKQGCQVRCGRRLCHPRERGEGY